MQKICLIIMLVLAGFSGRAQEKGGATAPDWESPEKLVASLYDVISGPAGERHWQRLRSYCKPEVQFNVLSRTKDGSSVYRSLSLDEYIAMAGEHFKANPFYETQLGQTVQRFGPITHVFSAYQSAESPEGTSFDRGVNSIQLVKDEGRWWIVNILWTSETDEHPIPAELIQN